MEDKTYYIRPKYKSSKKEIVNLENFRSIKKTKIKLSNFVTLVGGNSTGKTNILEKLFRLQGNYFDLDDLLEKFSKKYFFVYDRISSDYKLEYNLKYKTIGLNDIEFYLNFFEENKKYNIKGFEDTVIIPTNKIEFDKDKEKRVDVFNKSYNRFFVDQKNKRHEYYSLLFSMFHLKGTQVVKDINKKLMKLLEIGFNINGRNSESIFKILSLMPEINDNINNVIGEILNLNKNGKKISIILSLDIDTDEKNGVTANQFKVLIKDEEEESVVPPSFKSAGINSIIVLVTIIEFLKVLILKGHENYRELNFLMLIDEPELHIHPSIQIELAKYLYDTSVNTNKKIRMVLATHSPFMVNTNGLESTYIVDYSKEKGTVANKLLDYTQEMGTESCNILKPIEYSLGVEFNDFLKPTIVVEGEEELFLFKRVKGIFNYIVNIKNIKGKNNISPYLILFNQYKSQNEKFLIFLDADVKESDIKSIGKKKEVLNALGEHLYFIGKEVYKHNDYIVGEKLKVKGKFGEALEDLIIEIVGEDKLKEIVEEQMIHNEVEFLESYHHDLEGISYFEIKEIFLKKILKTNKDLQKKLFKAIKVSLFHEMDELENFKKFEKIILKIVKEKFEKN